MDSVTFHHDSVLSDVHMLQPRARHLMTRLNRAGQPVFVSRFRLLPQDETGGSSSRKKRVSEQIREDQISVGDRVSGQSPEDQQSSVERVGGQSPEDQQSSMDRVGGQSPEDQQSSVDRVGGQSPEDQQSSGDRVGGRSPEDQQSSGDRVSGRSPDSGESSDEDHGVVLDQDGDFDFTRRRLRRQFPPECGRDEVCPVLLSQVTPLDLQDLEDPTEEDGSSEVMNILRIEHTMATLLEDVGKQVWRGALLLADWVLSQRGAFTGATVLELGAGTGLSSIITASVAKRVYCTDVGEDLLSMCRRNVSLNKHLMEHNGGEVRVRQLDWLQRDLCTDAEQEFSWSEEDVADLYDHTTLIIAADVVYDDDFTDAFFRTLYQLCSSFNRSCDIYISIEKRLNFTLRHMDVCCEAYEHFRRCLSQLQDLPGPPAFTVQRVALNFPQCVMYERVEQLELWKVSASYPSGQQETSADH